MEGVGEDEVILLEVVNRGTENEAYKTIENEILLDEVFKEFQELFDQEDEGE